MDCTVENFHYMQAAVGAVEYRPTVSRPQLMKDGDYPSPVAALSFPVSKKVSIYFTAGVTVREIPVVAWRSPGSNSRPYCDLLHRNRTAVTTRPWRISYVKQVVKRVCKITFFALNMVLCILGK